MQVTKTGFTQELARRRKLLLRAWLLMLVLPVLYSPVPANSQSRAEFERWKNQYLGEFQQYKDQKGQEFAQFLQQRWQPFDTEQGIVRDDAPKPVSIPIAKTAVPDNLPPAQIPPPASEPLIAAIRIPQHPPAPPRMPLPQTVEHGGCHIKARIAQQAAGIHQKPQFYIQ